MKHITKNWILILLFLMIVFPAIVQGETKTFIAYSMKVAQTRVEEAMRKGEDFRKKQPELFYLGGITKPWAVVLDTETNDWILVGERDTKSSVLTLDDWVVALRARFIYPDKDPGVTIDPRPCETCLKSGKKEGCSHYTKQDVRFFGGIEDTYFGQVCCEADWLMKKIGLSLEKLPVKNLKSYFDLCTEQRRNSGSGISSVGSRFWFFPIVNQVNVFGDVVLLEQFKMGVFTEVLYAEVSGKPVADIDKFEHYPSEGFSRSFSENYDAAAQARDVLETLRGLTRMAALAKGLTQVDDKPKFDFYMSGYPIEKSKTQTEVEVLKNENREVDLWVKGGVELMALAMRLKGGDAGALKELVLKGRKAVGPNALTWGFEMHMQDGRLAGVVIPERSVDYDQIVPLFQMACFLLKKRRNDDAIESFNKILKLNSRITEVYNERGIAYIEKGDYSRAVEDFNKSIILNPNNAIPYNNRGVAYGMEGNYDCSIADCNKSIVLNSNFAAAYNNRGLAYYDKGDYDLAIEDFNKSIALNPNNTDAYNNRGYAYYDKGDYDLAIEDFNKSIAIDPTDAKVYNYRGIIYYKKGNYDLAVADCSRCIALNPKYTDAYINRGIAYYDKGDYNRALEDFNKSIALNPNNTDAYYNRGYAYYDKGDYNRAIKDFNKSIILNPNNAETYYNIGSSYGRKGDLDNAIKNYDKCIALNPNNADAYNDRGIIYCKKGDYNHAIENFDKAIVLDPNNAIAYYNRALAYGKKGDHNRSIDDLNKAIALNPNLAKKFKNK